VGFKEAIQEYGKEITASFVCGGVTYGDTEIISMNPHFEGSLLRSVMKCMDIEVKRGTEISDTIIQTPKFGVKGPGDTDYFYKEYGTYIIKEQKTDEEQDTVILECYDLMLQAMVPYDLVLEYPVTIEAFLDAICDRFGWVKGYKETGFTNRDMSIDKELYDASYTFRDVLDEIAQVAGESIVFAGDALCFVSPMFNLSARTIDASNLKSLKLGEVYGPVNSLVLARTPQEDNIYRRDEESIAANGLTEIRIENNQIIEQNRDFFIDALFSCVKGLQFTLYELDSFGIGYLNFGDKFNIQTPDGALHQTAMFCNDLKIDQGLSETSKLEAPAKTTTDYTAASESDKLLNQTVLKVDKQAGEITALATKTTNIENDVSGIDERVTNMAKIVMDAEKVNVEITKAIEGINSVTTSTGYTFDHEGLHIKKSDEEMENLLDNTGMYVNRGSDNILTANNEGVDAINLRSRQFLIVGSNSRFENYGSNRTACFYIGGS
jgi:hypothetical protein